jgi:hypothetical protein
MLFTIFKSVSSTKQIEDTIYDMYCNHAYMSFVPAYLWLILKNSVQEVTLPTLLKYAISKTLIKIFKIHTSEDTDTFYAFKGLHYIINVTQIRA